jgi:hypothetical protein
MGTTEFEGRQEGARVRVVGAVPSRETARATSRDSFSASRRAVASFKEGVDRGRSGEASTTPAEGG